MYRSYNYSTSMKVFMIPARSSTGVAAQGNGGGQSQGSTGATTDYAGNWNVIPDVGGNVQISRFSIQTITDGSSNTILVGEKSLRTDQYSPRYGWNWDETIAFGGSGGTCRGPNWDTWRNTTVNGIMTPTFSQYWNGQATTIQKDGPNIDQGGAWGSPHTGGAHFLMGDGSVSFIRYGVDRAQFWYRLTPTGNEVVNGSF